MAKQQRDYFQTMAAIDADPNLTPEQRVVLKKNAADLEYGSKSFDINEFDDLLDRLESSKIRQQREKSVEGRRDIYSQGMAAMMSNF